MTYGDLKDLNRGAFVDKVLQDNALYISSDRKYCGYQRVLTSMVCKFFDKKTYGSGIENGRITQINY